jgi:ABC-2 type transport system ATP-binding protein
VIAVEKLVKNYGSLRAVDEVTFSVSPGEVLGFLGPNGAGKTTTMKVLSGFLSATSGKATVGGMDVATQSLEVRRILGYLAEHNALYTDMLVSEYLQFVATMRGIPGARRRSAVSAVVETCDLEEYYYRRIGTLSNGFRQRVGLASAMVHEPQVLILDEPTSGLDPIEIKKIRELVRMLGQTKTVILSTHILQEVEATCDRVVIISRGKLVADGTPASLCRQVTRTPRFQVTLAGGPDELAETLGRLEGAGGVEELPRDGARRRYWITGADEARLAKGIVTLAREQGLELLELAPVGTRLEDAFAQLAGQTAEGTS